MSERATVRPITLARLVELTNSCETNERATDDIETALDVSHRRARGIILEASRIGLLHEEDPEEDEESVYQTTQLGMEFLSATRNEKWGEVSDILEKHSPHYGAFLDSVKSVEPADPETVLTHLEEQHEQLEYEFNETSLGVLGDWGERLGAIQRNAFSGSYYRPTRTIPSEFASILLSVFEELEETAGVNLNQRYLSIPELREATCERLRCTRQEFDNALVTLAGQNVGKIELSGAPMDTGAKDATLGIKQIELSAENGLVSTDQSTDPIMAGVEQYGKQYYYLAVHDDDITYEP